MVVAVGERAVSCNAIVIVIHNYVICMCVHAWLAVVMKVHVTWQGPFEIVKRKKRKWWSWA